MNSPFYVRLLFWSFFPFLLACSRDGQVYSLQKLDAFLRQRIAVAYADLDLATDALASAINEQCAEGLTEDGEGVIRENWKNSNAAWQRVQIINFGPVADQNHAHAIAFYPSSRANLEKRITALLESDTAITPESLKVSGVSLRGLPAMEYLLYANLAADNGNPSPQRRCNYLAALATLLKGHTSYLSSEWRSVEDHASDSSAGGSTQALLESLLNGINERLSVIVAVKIEKVLDGSVDALESPYSEQSLINIGNNFAFIQDLYGNHEKEGILRFLAAQGHEDISREMSVRLNLLQTHLTELGSGSSILQVAADGDEKLRTVAQLFRSVQEYHATRVADALGVYIGFNSADGD